MTRNTYMVEELNRSKTAKARGDNLSISPKVAIEISSFLRGMELTKAIATLEQVVLKKVAVPYKRFTNAVGHRKGPMASGRYPVKAATEFLKLLENTKANATTQGLTGRLVIIHIAANRASEPMRNRAKERVTFKRAHVEVVVAEREAPVKKTRASPAKKAPTKKEVVAEQKE